MLFVLCALQVVTMVTTEGDGNKTSVQVALRSVVHSSRSAVYVRVHDKEGLTTSGLAH